MLQVNLTTHFQLKLNSWIFGQNQKKTGIAGPKLSSHSWALDFLSVYLALKSLEPASCKHWAHGLKLDFKLWIGAMPEEIRILL